MRSGILLFQKLILGLSLLCFLLIWGGTCFLAQKDFFSDLLPSGVRLLLLIPATALLLLLLLFLFRHFQKCSEKRLFCYSVALFALMALLFLLLIREFRIVPLNDSHSVMDQALSMALSGEKPMDTASIYANYFSKYSNNYAVTLLFVGIFRLLARLGVGDSYTPLYFLNMFCLLLGTLFTWLAARSAFGLCTAVKALFLCVCNPVYYLMVFWVYTNTLSVPFLMGLIYVGLCIYRAGRFGTKCLLAAVWGAVCSLGFLLRPTTVIPAIALLICFLFYAIKRLSRGGRARDKASASRNFSAHRRAFLGWLGVSAAALAAAGSVYVGASKLCDSYFCTVSEGNYPLTHWLMMGSHDSGRYNLADDRYTFSLATAEEKQSATLSQTLENYRTLGAAGTLLHVSGKIVTTWSDGYFAMDKRLSQTMRYSRLYAWLVGEKSDLFHLYCQSFWLAVVLLVICSCIGQLRTTRTVPFLLTLSLFGGILFYCFWEVKEAYAIPFLPLFFLLAANGGSLPARRTAAKRVAAPLIRLHAHFARTAAIALLALCGVLAVLLCGRLCRYEIVHRDYSILCSSGTWLTDVNLNDGDTLIQEFYPNESFNEITLLVSARDEDGSNDCRIAASLTDASGNSVYASVITADEVRTDGTVLLDTGLLPASPEDGYRLRLTKEAGSCGDLTLRTRKGICLDTYDGDFYLNGDAQGTDLYLRVSHTFSAPYCKPATSAALCLGGWFIAAGICYTLFFYTPEYFRLCALISSSSSK